jgi:hypothetical protein
VGDSHFKVQDCGPSALVSAFFCHPRDGLRDATVTATEMFLQFRQNAYCGECSEAKDHVKQLSKNKVYCCVIAVTLVATALVCLHGVSLMYACF